MKNIIEAFKNPKKRALIQLGGYFIFFIFVFVLINMNKDNSSNYYDTYENEEKNEITDVKESKIQTYSYKHIIDNVEINGTYIDSQNIFIVNDTKYYNYDMKTYLYDTKEEVEYFDIDKYSYESIEKLIETSEFVEKTTYKDNTEKTTYIVEDNNYCTDCNMIVESNEYITQVIIGDSIELNYMKIS